MQFEWDPIKSAENEDKHGVTFEEATAIWEQVHIEVETIARVRRGEQRNATVGWIGGKLFVAIWTKRNDVIRLISVRRARPHEEKIFTKSIQN